MRSILALSLLLAACAPEPPALSDIYEQAQPTTLGAADDFLVGTWAMPETFEGSTYWNLAAFVEHPLAPGALAFSLDWQDPDRGWCKKLGWVAITDDRPDAFDFTMIHDRPRTEPDYYWTANGLRVGPNGHLIAIFAFIPDIPAPVQFSTYGFKCGTVQGDWSACPWLPSPSWSVGELWPEFGQDQVVYCAGGTLGT